MKKLLYLACLASLPAWAALDADLVAARNGGPALFAAQDSAQGTVLESYPRYWALSRNLDAAGSGEVQAFLQRYADSALAEKLRLDWAKRLARSEAWAEFAQEYAKLPAVARDDDVQCSDTLLRLKQGDGEALAQARQRWLTQRTATPGCAALFDQLSGRLSEADIWRRVRLMLAAGNVNSARAISQATGQPLSAAQVTSPGVGDLSTQAGRESALFAIVRQAKNDPQGAGQLLASLEGRLPKTDAGYGWGQVGMAAAKRQDGWGALSAYAKADKRQLSDEQWEWWARAALRVGHWETVAQVTDDMPEALRNQPAWTYWQGRALKQRGKTQDANQRFTRISQLNSFYGLLARDELGTSVGETPARYTPSEQEIASMRQNPSLARALALFDIAQRFARPEFREDAKREWRFAMRNQPDESLLAAAEIGRQAGFYDMAIYSADRTVNLHDFTLRYLSPYRDATQRYARQLNLDEAWVYGLIRQESRFVHIARSGVGASGLMQLMPATAKWAANKMGLGSFSVNDVSTNIQLGTWYLRHVFDGLDDNAVMATAAYNAGPGRARAWQSGDTLEGAIYAETIPFTETRDYVQKVMANAVHYSGHLGSARLRLKDRMGWIPGR